MKLKSTDTLKLFNNPRLVSQLLVACIVFLSCSQLNCNDLPQSYRSYEEAVSTIRNAKFNLHEKIKTSKSSWIRGAEYYSCDNKTGYFILILKTDSKEYIHNDMPVNVWESFKNAESFGKFYNTNIKHKYYFKLNS